MVTTWDGDDPGEPPSTRSAPFRSARPSSWSPSTTERRIVPALRKTGRYAVNILGEDGQASRTASPGGRDRPAARARPYPTDRGELCGAAWHPGTTGLPILDDAIASLECTVVDVHPAGDHDLYIARVDAASAGGDRRSRCCTTRADTCASSAPACTTSRASRSGSRLPIRPYRTAQRDAEPIRRLR